MSTAPRSFTAFLTQSLQILERDCPAAYAQLGGRLGARSLRCAVDAEIAIVHRAPTGFLVEAADRPCTIELRTQRTVLGSLLAGQFSLNQAIRRDEVFLRGRADDLAALYDALITYLRGAARCSAMTPLLHEFLGTTASGGA